MRHRCFLLGLDGATFDILDPLMDAGVMPFLKSLASVGSRAVLTSVVPPITPPAWTSMVTGRSPGHHGIFDFFHREERSHHLRFTTSADVHCETIWSAASHQGLRVTVLNFPLMMPPPEINGYVMAGGWLTSRQLRLGCRPEGLYDRVKALPGFDSRELAMDMAGEGKALDGCRAEEYEDWIRFHIRREQHWAGILKHLMREEPCDLTALLFDGTDKIQHLCWRFLLPDAGTDGLSEWEHRVRALCLEYYRTVDRLIGEILGDECGEATVILASDHGFGPQREIFFVNTWLERNGYLRWADNDGNGDGHADSLGMGELGRHSFLIDWNHTLAYASVPSSNGIHIVTEGGGYGRGVAQGEYVRFRDELVAKLRAVPSSLSSAPLVSQVWTRESAFPGPFVQRAPDLTLGLRDGGLISILRSGTPVKRREWPSGTHRMDGILLAAGPGIRRGARLEPVSILDVFPMMLYALGLPVPEEAEGRVPAGFFEDACLKREPVVISGHSGAGEPSVADPPDGQPIYDEEAEAKVAARLRALGYID